MITDLYYNAFDLFVFMYILFLKTNDKLFFSFIY